MTDLLRAAKAFVDQMRYVLDSPDHLRVWELAQSHFGDYKGPNYEEEFRALRAAVEAEEAKPAVDAEELRLLRETLRDIVDRGPIETFGSNTPERCVQWVGHVRDTAHNVLETLERKRKERWLENRAAKGGRG